MWCPECKSELARVGYFTYHCASCAKVWLIEPQLVQQPHRPQLVAEGAA